MRGETPRQAGRRTAPDLSVVVCTLGGTGAEETIRSLEASGKAAGCRLEIVAVWQSAEPAPDLRPATVELVFPSGLSYARNRGLALAGADLVAFVDDDEIVDPAWARGVLDGFEQTGAAALFGPVAPRDDRGLPYCRYDGDGELRVVNGRRRLPWTIGTGGNMAFRRDVLVSLGGFDVLFGAGAVARSAEDTELIHRLLRSGSSIAWTPDAVVYHPTKTAPERLASRSPYAYGIGKLARRHNDPVLAARYAKAIVGTAATAARARDGRRLRETRETLRGFVSGVAFRAKPRSPEAELALAPELVRELIEGEQIEPLASLYRPAPHFIYRVGAERILHVYVHPQRRLRDGLDVRERARAESALPGIPRVLAAGDSNDALWLLEERLPGAVPRSREVRQWFGPAAEWVLRLGDGEGGLVRDGGWWADEARTAIEAAPSSLRPSVATALDEMGSLPARRLHGDFQRKNLLVDENGGVAVADWERAYDAGPPGFDLLFLAVMARSDWPDRELLRDVAGCRDPAWAPLRALLRRAGLEGVELKRYVLAALAIWAADERERLDALGLPRPRRARYRELLLDLGAGLA